MNEVSRTIVSGELHEEMEKAGVAEGYVPVPAHLEARARRLLKGQSLADMDKRFRYLAKKSRKQTANRTWEEKLREAKARLAVK